MPRYSSAWVERTRFAALLAFLIACLLGGGAARADVVSLLYVRPAAILCIAAFLLTGPIEFRSYRALFFLLAGLAAAIAVQLIPLPPDLWHALPGRERYARGVALGGSDAWRPISLTPDLTLNSLLALLAPLAALVGYAGIRPDQRRTLLIALIAAILASAVWGIFQIGSGQKSAAYLYRITNAGSPVGFFSNRNHQAVLLAMGFPVLRSWTLMPAGDEQYRRLRLWIAACLGLFLVPMILLTGSRAGMVLGLLGLVAAYLMAPRRKGRGAPRDRRRAIAMTMAIAAPLLLGFAAVFLGRAIALDRLLDVDMQSELRIQYLPLLLRMTGDFLPLGSGFGSFDPVFRGFEPDWSLDPSYLNHAHNDVVEIVLTGGVPAAIVVLAFLAWFARRLPGALRQRATTPERLLARVGAIMIVILLLASVVDYPLRTPLMAAIFAIACGWLSEAGKPRGEAQASAS